MDGEKMTNVIAEIAAIASGEVGYHEGRSNGHWDNFQRYSPAVPGLEWSQNQAWCATFVSWLALKAKVADLFPRTASCALGVSWFKNKGRFSAYPAVGAQVFFGSGGGSHTGLVVAYDADTITTVEGNTNTNGSAEGDGVYRKTRYRRDAYTYGYGYPAYVGGSMSADPDAAKYGYKVAAKATAPAVVEKPASTTKPKVSVKHLNAARKADIPAATGHTTYKAEVLIVEAALVAEKHMTKKYADGSWGTLTDDGYNAFRRAEGYTGDDAKGAVGLGSLKKLAAKHGFTATA
jgi:hypothetical protein